jgi:type VI secretion system protein VasD
MAMSVNSFFMKSAAGMCRTLVMLIALVLSACASHSADERVATRTSLSASKDVNPDINGRPSPVVVRIFQLHGDGEFLSADFFALYTHEKESLGASLIAFQEFELRPGEHLDTKILLAKDARYVGAIAGYRDLSTAQWRVLRTRPSRSLFVHESVVVNVDRNTLTLSVNH